MLSNYEKLDKQKWNLTKKYFDDEKCKQYFECLDHYVRISHAVMKQVDDQKEQIIYEAVDKRPNCFSIELEKKLHKYSVKKWTKLCFHCNEGHALFLCSNCLQARYCNAECQLSNWPEHKQNCQQI